MIHRFGLRNFKSHRDTELALGRFTMLVGDNASGKTSVLEALALQSRLGDNPVAALRDASAPEDLLRRGSNEPIVLHAEGARVGRAWRTELQLHVRPVPLETNQGKPDWGWELRGSGAADAIEFEASASSSGSAAGSGAWGRFTTAFGSAAVYRLRADRVADAAYSDEPNVRIEADGTNTAVALAALKLGDDEAFQRVEDALRRLVPSVQRIRIRPATVHRASDGAAVVGSKLYFDFRGAPNVPAHGASHGTLILLALLTILHGASPPNVVLLDDFDHALHPRAQMELVRLIKGLLALDEFRDMQVVTTTHSPYALDELEPSDVYAFALRDDGTVASRRLSEHPEAARTRGTLKAGQLWSLDPERDWVLPPPTASGPGVATARVASSSMFTR
jgi:predicted ATPase